MEALVVVINSIVLFGITVHTVPPAACFANFRWDDCGKAPQPVMYYWKLGSRCEVGIWRGCLPSLNMFKDEYECVSTCIFTVRAKPPDFHMLSLKDYYDDLMDFDFTTPFEGVTTNGTSNGTAVNGTDTGDTNSTDTDSSPSGGEGENTEAPNEGAEGEKAEGEGGDAAEGKKPEEEPPA